MTFLINYKIRTEWWRLSVYTESLGIDRRDVVGVVISGA